MQTITPFTMECEAPVKSSLRTTVLATLLLLTGSTASAQLALVAAVDFDADTLGQHPDVSLSGGFYPTFSSGVGHYSVEANLGTMTGQSVQAHRDSGSGGFNFGINLPAEAQSSESYRLRWRFAPLAGAPYMSVILRGPNLAIHGSLKLTSSSVLFSTAWGSQNDITIGTLTMGESVYIDWTIDRVTGVQTLSLDGVVVVDAMETGYHSPLVDATRLAFEGAFQSTMTVALDDVEIFAGTGTTPNETTSWGQIKTIYR